MEYQHLRARPNLRLNGSAAFIADSPILIAVRYQGSLASATVEVASGDITFKHGAAGGETVDNTVGASGVVADGTYTTLGAMVDAINASPNWKAEIVDGLRSDASAAALKTLSAVTLSPVRTQVLGLFADTSASLNISYRISARRDNWNMSQKGKQSILKESKSLVDITSGALSFSVFNVDPRSGATRLLASGVPSDNSEFTYNVGSGNGELRSDVGCDLLVRVAGSANLPDTGAYLRVAGFVE